MKTASARGTSLRPLPFGDVPGAARHAALIRPQREGSYLARPARPVVSQFEMFLMNPIAVSRSWSSSAGQAKVVRLVQRPQPPQNTVPQSLHLKILKEPSGILSQAGQHFIARIQAHSLRSLPLAPSPPGRCSRSGNLGPLLGRKEMDD